MKIAGLDIGTTGCKWMQMKRPQEGYQERCYYHTMQDDGRVSIWQPKLNLGVEINCDVKQLDCFTEWKMMGVRDYVLGLEYGNCYPDGRNVMREKGILKFIEPDEKVRYEVEIRMVER